MSVVKTPRAFILIPDAEGKITNYEIEFMPKYTGTDPDIAKSFNSSPVREEVSAEEFAKHVDILAQAGANAAQALSAEVAELKTAIENLKTDYEHQLESASIAHNTVVAQRNDVTAKLDGLLKGIAQQLIPFAQH